MAGHICLIAALYAKGTEECRHGKGRLTAGFIEAVVPDCYSTRDKVRAVNARDARMMLFERIRQ